ncbi:MAG TPA: trypsin-like peptidase domain-containing protein [Moraxellaceae bacterium]|nr:trypsin-like peptidase domain-containing protein [Moraxellaceae bacterium]
MRFRIALPWILLAIVLAYVLTRPGMWPGHANTPASLAPPHPLPTAAVSAGGPVSYSAAVRAAAPAVVNIYTTQKVRMNNPFLADPFLRRFFGEGVPDERMQASLGSGVIISPEGYVLTNNHVVAQADEIVVALQDGRETKAAVIGTDPGTDLALLRIKLDSLPVIPLRDDPTQVGDVVLAIGNPFGVGQTVTQGIISATGRQGLGINTYEDFIQTDAAINPGNSGGALIDVAGNLVGINSAIFSQSGGNMGIGFAIPVSLARNVMQSLIKDGRVVRGWMGIEVQPVEPQQAAHADAQARKGVAIAGVMRGGPAWRGGLTPGDVMVRINGKPLDNASQAINLIATLAPGTEVPVSVLRGSHEMEFKVKVGERPTEANPDTPER